MTAATLSATSSYAALSPSNSHARRPRWALRQRPAAFFAAFDEKTLFYDCFRADDGERVLLVGPPPRGLEVVMDDARFEALPSRTPLTVRRFVSLSVAITSLEGAPHRTTAIRIELGGESFELMVQPSETARLAGRRLLFSVNRDNELAWVREWALYHAQRHGTDTVILFDNGSTHYGVEELDETLRGVPGIVHVAVPSWPHRFGPVDQAVFANPYWARFLQISSMSVVLRRYGERAAGLLDCDIDELAGTHSGRSIYDLAAESAGGLVAFTGTWIEATGSGQRHRDFTQRLVDEKARRSVQRKWALDPSRTWVRKLSVHPYWHWIEGRDRAAKSMPQDAFYWHFKGINTNWKHERTTPPDGALEADLVLVRRLAGLPE